MKKLVTFFTTAVLAFSILAGIAAVLPSHVAAHEEEETVSVQAAETNTSEETYKYTAKAGNSYSLIARKAIQTYGLKNKVNLSQAKIIAAETYMTQAAGSPELNLGQEIIVKESTVKGFIEQAQKLTATDEASWNEYASNANFDTNAVG